MHLPINKRRTLYIGLGGAGAQTILHLKKLYIDAYGDVPPMVKFLVIDTDKAICDKSIIARSGKYIGLNKDEICICVVSGAKEVYQNNSERYNWIPSPPKKKSSLYSWSKQLQYRSPKVKRTFHAFL